MEGFTLAQEVVLIKGLVAGFILVQGAECIPDLEAAYTLGLVGGCTRVLMEVYILGRAADYRPDLMVGYIVVQVEECILVPVMIPTKAIFHLGRFSSRNWKNEDSKERRI
ncbi:hypothetical protein [Salinibacter ruber]|uniref:hypothetical protein n=1 Tax=Salinibacter ruber TaxID=146919 RepID=UPI0020749AE7|nr:hypothetical protein [Salinibacter ruber]